MSVKVPEPRVKTARWVYVRETRDDGNEYAYYKCSNCVMTEQDSFYPWCALCGAYMTNHEKFTRDLKAGETSSKKPSPNASARDKENRYCSSLCQSY